MPDRLEIFRISAGATLCILVLFISLMMLKYLLPEVVIRTIGKKKNFEIVEVTKERVKRRKSKKWVDKYCFNIKKDNFTYCIPQGIPVRDSANVELRHDIGDKVSFYYHRKFGFHNPEYTNLSFGVALFSLMLFLSMLLFARELIRGNV